jgi:glycosyltransferase involved in cell wall biosynthesis
LAKGEQGTRSTQVIIAALNEEEGIGLTIAELQQYLGNSRVLLVDGNSSDRTVEVAKNLGAEIFFQDGTGKGDALTKAFSSCDSDVDYFVITDADYTYPAEYLPEMIRILDQNPKIGMVCGNRFNGNVDKEALRSMFYLGNRFLALTNTLLNGIPLKDPLTGLRVVRAEIVRDWRAKSQGFDIEVELNHYVERMGYGIVEIPIQYRQRLGEKKLKIIHGASIFKRIVLETYKHTGMSTWDLS